MLSWKLFTGYTRKNKSHKTEENLICKFKLASFLFVPLVGIGAKGEIEGTHSSWAILNRWRVQESVHCFSFLPKQLLTKFFFFYNTPKLQEMCPSLPFNLLTIAPVGRWAEKVGNLLCTQTLMYQSSSNPPSQCISAAPEVLEPKATNK